MFALKELVLPANRPAVDESLYLIWMRVVLVIAPVKTTRMDPELLEHFQAFINSEEEHVKKDLEAVHYRIDDLETIVLILGSGRVEKVSCFFVQTLLFDPRVCSMQSVFPFIYLLLKHHFEILRLCRTVQVRTEELLDSADSVCWAYTALSERYQHLLSN